jgi:hypothetical protein
MPIAQVAGRLFSSWPDSGTFAMGITAHGRIPAALQNSLMLPWIRCGWLMALALSLMGAAPPTPDCRVVRERRDQLLRDAMQAEIALLHGVRERLCPREEALASAANALESREKSEATLDYTAYIHCREQAERELQRTHSVRYRNRRGVPYYTPAGEQLARQASVLEEQVDLACPALLRP